MRFHFTMVFALSLCTLSLLACGDDDATDGGDLDGAMSDGGRTDLDGGRADGGGAVDGGGGSDGGGGDTDGGGSTDGGAHLDYCPGYTAPTSPCRTGADCTSAGEACILPGTPLCGACMIAMRACETDDTCKGGVCVETTMPCSCDGPSTSCVAACTATSCDAGEVCGTDGHCAPESCSEGYTCPVNSRCDPTSTTGPDGHGCAPLPCVMDDDCDCGVCIGGSCLPAAGTCGALPG